MAYAPCKNPNCKSYGRPHPNCKCYGEMAEGGEVSRCSGPHKSDCEYFSTGGEVGHLNPQHAVAGHIFNGGMLGMLKMHKDMDLDKYDRAVTRGHKTMDSELGRILDGQKLSPEEDRSRHHKIIEEWMAKGGLVDDIHEERYKQHEPQHLDQGGELKPMPDGVLHNHPIESAYPDHNIAMQTAKGRAASYLSALRPQEHQPKLAFDDAPDQTAKKRSYESARRIADHPMTILHEISRGTIDAEQVAHLKAMYPEVMDAMQKKITEKIIKTQLDGKKPNRNMRQGLSLLMGVPLSGDLTPQGIMAAQSVFQAKRPAQDVAPQQKSGKPSGSKSSLTNSDKSFLTSEQVRVQRDQKHA